MILFHVMRNAEITGTALVRDFELKLQEILPSSWHLEFDENGRPASRPDLGVDLIAKVTDPSGASAEMLIECKVAVTARDVHSVIWRARQYGGDAEVVILAPFLSPRTREVITALGAGYADATGNLQLKLDRPALFVSREGAQSNPWAKDSPDPLKSLKGPGAGRVVRTLCELCPPYGIRELAERSGAPASTVSRVVALLDREALLRRNRTNSDKRIIEVDWKRTIERWCLDYSFSRSNRGAAYLEPRQLPALITKLQDTHLRYSITGSLAAAAVEPITVPRLATLYVEDAAAAVTLGLRPAETGGNVILAQPFDEVVFERTWTKDGLVYAGLAQVAADLQTGPGRAPAEAVALLDWMEKNQDAWRS